MQNTDIIINRKDSTIIITKSFMKKSEKFGSPEYYALRQACNENPTFKIDVKVSRKRASENTTHKKKKPTPSIKTMKLYISNYPDAEKRMEAFNRVMILSEIQKSPYNFIRNWFIKYYPSFENTEADANGILLPNNKAENKEIA